MLNGSNCTPRSSEASYNMIRLRKGRIDQGPRRLSGLCAAACWRSDLRATRATSPVLGAVHVAWTQLGTFEADHHWTVEFQKQRVVADRLERALYGTVLPVGHGPERLGPRVPEVQNFPAQAIVNRFQIIARPALGSAPSAPAGYNFAFSSISVTKPCSVEDHRAATGPIRAIFANRSGRNVPDRSKPARLSVSRLLDALRVML